MTQATSKQRTFDIEEYKTKVLAALERLQAEQKPGDGAGKGGKADVLKAAKKEIKDVLAKGYTAKQVAAAIQQDVFGILPKTITEMIAEQPAKKRTSRKKQEQNTEQSEPVNLGQNNTINTATTFNITQDH